MQTANTFVEMIRNHSAISAIQATYCTLIYTNVHAERTYEIQQRHFNKHVETDF